MKDNELAMLCRLAIRQEGEWVNAYLAPRVGGMGNALLLATIKRSIALKPGVFDKWKELMADIMLDAIEAVTGKRATALEEQPPPENERSGSA